MAEKHSIYDCPYCGKKSFNPLTKALAGNMNTKGRVCKACGRRVVNGKTSAIVRTVLMVVAIIIVFATYFIESSDTANSPESYLGTTLLSAARFRFVPAAKHLYTA